MSEQVEADGAVLAALDAWAERMSDEPGEARVMLAATRALASKLDRAPDAHTLRELRQSLARLADLSPEAEPPSMLDVYRARIAERRGEWES